MSAADVDRLKKIDNMKDQAFAPTTLRDGEKFSCSTSIGAMTVMSTLQVAVENPAAELMIGFGTPAPNVQFDLAKTAVWNQASNSESEVPSFL